MKFYIKYSLGILVPFVLVLFNSTTVFSQSEIGIQDTASVITYRIKGKTATGHHTYTVKEPFVALSRDLLKKYPLHSYIKLTDCRWEGTYKVLDVMNSRHRKTIDVFYKKKTKFNKVSCICSAAEK